MALRRVKDGVRRKRNGKKGGKAAVIKRMRQGTRLHVQQQGGKGISDWTQSQHVLAPCGNAWLVKLFVYDPLRPRCCPHETGQEIPV